jgi:hypothetical protein
MSNYFRWNAGRKRQGTPTLESQPGAHTGATRKVIPGYSDSNIVFLNTSTGNDANTGASIAQALLTYSAAATAAGTTKKIRLVNSATLTSNITKPTEATIGTTSTINAATTGLDVFTLSGTPSFGATTITSVCYCDRLARWVAVGGSGKAAYSNDNGTTWTQASVLPTSSLLTCVIYVDALRLFIATGGSGNISYSTNGTSWTTVNLALAGSRQFYSVAYSPDLELLVAVGDAGMIFKSTDGITWTVVTGWEQASGTIGTTIIIGAFWSDYYNKFYICGDSGIMYSSTDGLIWSVLTSSFSSTAINAITANGATLVAVAYSGKIAYSSDGATWTQAATPSFGADTVFGVTYNGQFGKFCAVGDAGKIAWSTDGNVWTQSGTTGYGANQVRGAFGRFGKVITVGEGGKIGLSNAPGLTISAAVAGFSVSEATYSGTVTAYNCTLKQPGTTAALSLDSCRVTESGSHISNNAVTATAILVEGDMHYTGVYAAANALDLSVNTIVGTLYIYNGSTTNYERIRDNIIENGVQSSYPVTVTSGNTRGTSSDGTIFGQFCTTSDPLFVDTTDYKLQRVLDGYQYDSPMVAASQYYYNQATTQTFRDNGAWSYNESAATYKYQRTFDFLMPATSIGSAIDFVRHNRANLHVAEDGTPDAVNTPDSRWEEIVMQFKTLPSDHIDFINWLEGQVDMTCDISLSPSLTPTTAVVASGATSAGEAVITITDNSGLDSGDQLTIDGNTYTVLYTYGTTKVVLDRVTTTALTDTESITVKYDTGFGEYQYVPMLERRLSRWYETDENYLRGLQIRFARKLP